MLNVPPVVTVTLVVMGLVHAVRFWLLTPSGDAELLKFFAFYPARYEFAAQCGVPSGFAVDAWTFVSYALIHGDATHLGVNAVWFLAFGSAVARRFHAARFLIFFVVTAAAGAGVHLLTHGPECVPMVGASAAISGCMAAAIRFAFQHGGPLGLWRAQDTHAYHVPAAPLLIAIADPRVLAFLVVWFALNILLGVGSISLGGGPQGVPRPAPFRRVLSSLLPLS